MNQEISDRLNRIVDSLEAAITEARMAAIAGNDEDLQSSLRRLEGMIDSAALTSRRLLRFAISGKDDTLGARANNDTGEENV